MSRLYSEGLPETIHLLFLFRLSDSQVAGLKFGLMSRALLTLRLPD